MATTTIDETASVYGKSGLSSLLLRLRSKLTTIERSERPGSIKSSSLDANLASPHGSVKNSGTTLGILLHRRATIPICSTVVQKAP